eukprot:1738903-Alexandrium_andersonii.AAC.1
MCSRALELCIPAVGWWQRLSAAPLHPSGGLRQRAMADSIPPCVVRRVQALIDKEGSDVGPVTLWKDIAKILKEENIIYEAVVQPGQVLCHPCNRGSLGLNPHTVHKTGARILAVGCDRDELQKA